MSHVTLNDENYTLSLCFEKYVFVLFVECNNIIHWVLYIMRFTGYMPCSRGCQRVDLHYCRISGVVHCYRIDQGLFYIFLLLIKGPLFMAYSPALRYAELNSRYGIISHVATSAVLFSGHFTYTRRLLGVPWRLYRPYRRQGLRFTNKFHHTCFAFRSLPLPR